MTILAPSGRPARFDLTVKARYEGAMYSPNRSDNFWPSQSTEDSLDSYTVAELRRHSLDLYQNSPFIRGLITRLVACTVGTGIFPVPASSNPEYNTRAKVAYRLASRWPCVNNKWTMGQYQRVKFTGKLLKGQSFTMLTHGPSGRPRIQGIDADRIKGADKRDSSLSKQGILLEPEFYRPESYLLDGKTPVKAENMVHHISPIGDDQYNGEPILASAINTARDIRDILTLEKQAVKDASSHMDIIQTETGELDPRGGIQSRFNTAALTTDTVNRADYYRQQFGARPIVLRTNDKYTPYAPTRPGAAWQGFMDFLSETICLSTGWPPSVLLQIKVGGADTRRDMATAQRIVDIWQDDLANEFQQIYDYLMGEDTQLMANSPRDWNATRWYMPKKLTVDAGYTADADRKDVEAGLLTREEYWAQYQLNAEEQDKIIVDEAKRRKKQIEDAGMTVTEFVELIKLEGKQPAQLIQPEVQNV